MLNKNKVRKLICGYCREGELIFSEEIVPYSPAHYHCSHCDSTYPEHVIVNLHVGFMDKEYRDKKEKLEVKDSVVVIDSSSRVYMCIGYIRKILPRGYVVEINGVDNFLEGRQLELFEKGENNE